MTALLLSERSPVSRILGPRATAATPSGALFIPERGIQNLANTSIAGAQIDSGNPIRVLGDGYGRYFATRAASAGWNTKQAHGSECSFIIRACRVGTIGNSQVAYLACSKPTGSATIGCDIELGSFWAGSTGDKKVRVTTWNGTPETSLFVNGNKYASAALSVDNGVVVNIAARFSGLSGTGGTAEVVVGGYRAAQYAASVNIYFFALVNKALSDNELREYSLNPWSFVHKQKTPLAFDYGAASVRRRNRLALAMM